MYCNSRAIFYLQRLSLLLQHPAINTFMISTLISTLFTFFISVCHMWLYLTTLDILFIVKNVQTFEISESQINEIFKKVWKNLHCLKQKDYRPK